MNNKKWFRIVVWVMLIAMIASALLVVVQPLLY